MVQLRRCKSGLSHVDSSIHASYNLGEHNVLLGKGGVGRVIKSANVHTKVEHAVKLIPKNQKTGLNGEANVFAEVEALIHKSLDHPHIVRLFDTFEDASYQYLVMEVCAGGTLTELMPTWFAFSEVDSAILTQQILCALRYLHKAEVLHGDVLPQNVLLVNQKVPKDNLAKLCDFGCARRSVVHCSDLVGCGAVLSFLLGSIKFAPKGPKTTAVCTASGAAVHVSQDAKRVLDTLLAASPKKTTTAGLVLQAPWIRRNVMDNCSANILPSFIDKLRAFSSHCAFKKQACLVAARGLVLDDEQLAATRLFSKLNARQNGFLTPYELKQALEKANLKVRADITKLMQDSDIDNAGAMDYSTFLAIMLDTQTYKKEHVCRLAFSSFDHDGDGSATHEEIAAMLWGDDVHGQPIRGPVAELVQDIDRDGDGVISFEEFCHMMRTTSRLTEKTRQAEKLAVAATVPLSEVKSKIASMHAVNRQNRKLNQRVKQRKVNVMKFTSNFAIADNSDIADIDDLNHDFNCRTRPAEEGYDTSSTSLGEESDAESELMSPPLSARAISRHSNRRSPLSTRAMLARAMLASPSSLSPSSPLSPLSSTSARLFADAELEPVSMLPDASSFKSMPFVPASGSPSLKAIQLDAGPCRIVSM